MRVFVRVVERRGFARAAHDLALPRSRVSEAVQQLEKRLGVQLLVRTTRRVTPTAEGEEFHRRCRTILADLDNAEASLAGRTPAGPLRIDVHGTFAKTFLLPGLPVFLGRHPGIRLHVGEGDRLVDLIGEGIDCAIRVGEPAPSGLIGRRLGALEEGTFASPSYLERHGVPASPDDLEGHRMIGFVSSATRAVMPLRFQTADGLRTAALAASATVDSAEASAGLAARGLGLIQAPRYRVADELARGTLVEVLAQCPPPPMPVHLLHPEGRQLSPRVRAFMDWAVPEVSGRLRDSQSPSTARDPTRLLGPGGEP